MQRLKVIWLPLQNLLVEACRIVQPPLPVQRETLPQPGFQLRHPGPLAYRPPHTRHEIVATGGRRNPGLLAVRGLLFHRVNQGVDVVVIPRQIRCIVLPLGQPQ